MDALHGGTAAGGDIGDLSDVVHVLLRLAQEASAEILAHYRSPGTVIRKKDGSPVTPADEASNRLILNGLHKAYPGIPVLAEESADPKERHGARWLFVVDPLDGTKEYLARNDEFSVNIALLDWNRPVAGVIQMPVSGDVFCAAHGRGAWTNRLPQGVKPEEANAEGTEQEGTEAEGTEAEGTEADRVNDEVGHAGRTLRRIHVSHRTEGLVLACSRSHPSSGTKRIMEDPRVAKTFVAGSSFKGCLIACGEVDAYYRFGRTMEWDTAAMQIIVEEAGGVVRQLDGSPMIYNKPLPDNPNGFFILNRMENNLI